MSKCKHGHCLTCGDMCPKCGDDESKYNIGDKVTVCQLPENPPEPPEEPKKACASCGVLLSDMSSVDKESYFLTGLCKFCRDGGI